MKLRSLLSEAQSNLPHLPIMFLVKIPTILPVVIIVATIISRDTIVVDEDVSGAMVDHTVKFVAYQVMLH